jgi:hypothetical protein
MVAPHRACASSATGRQPAVVSPMAICLDEPEFGGLQGQQSLFAGAGEVVNGFIFDGGDGEQCGIPRAHPPRQLRRLTPVEFDAVGRLHTAVLSFVRHMTVKVFHELYTGFAISGAGCG